MNKPFWIRITRWGTGYNYDLRDAGGLYQTANPNARSCRFLQAAYYGVR